MNHATPHCEALAAVAFDAPWCECGKPDCPFNQPQRPRKERRVIVSIRALGQIGAIKRDEEAGR